MKIAFDTSVYHFTSAGMANYTKELIGALRKIDGCEVLELSFKSRYSRTSRLLRVLDTLKYDFLWRYRTLPRLLRQHQFDVFHSPLGSTWSKRIPTVVTVADLHLWHNPQDFRFWHRHSGHFFMKRALLRSRAVVTISDFVRQDVLAEFNLPDSTLVDTVYCGLNADRFVMTAKNETEVLENLGVSPPYLFSVATLVPNKNISRLLEAFAQICDQLPHKLIIVGAKGWKLSGLGKKLTDLGINHRVIFMGRVEHEDLVTLYGNADGFVFPSLYEGFGFPPLEAMVNRTPVLSSDVTSMPEVLGDAALLVNPYSVDDIAHGMLRLVNDEVLRDTLVMKGQERVKQFTWGQSARKLFEIYQEISRVDGSVSPRCS